MTQLGQLQLAGSLFAFLALPSCASVSSTSEVQVEAAGPVLDAAETAFPFVYRVPERSGEAWSESLIEQGWSMLGREDRSASNGSWEYEPTQCSSIPGSPKGWDAVVDAIAARAVNHRVVIINESHVVSRHRETTRRLLSKLRPLGFTVLAAETFNHLPDGNSPVYSQPPVAWPHINEGHYLREPAFGRMVREAKALNYKLAAYEQIFDSARARPSDPIESIAQREGEQAQHLATILREMPADERLLVHVGYSHAAEVPIGAPGRESEWMALRLKALTGIDPLTIAQTICRHEEGPAFLAQPPSGSKPGQFDLIVSHPVEKFEDQRPRWRRQTGDIATAIPMSLRSSAEPLVIEAFAWDEPFEAVPVDRVFVEPGEDPPLLLPPGRYRVRAVRLANP